MNGEHLGYFELGLLIGLALGAAVTFSAMLIWTELRYDRQGRDRGERLIDALQTWGGAPRPQLTDAQREQLQDWAP